MESTGATNKIQISESTAEYLTRSGKQHWIMPREDAVKAKGKGILKTYWLNPTGGSGGGGSAAGSDNNVTSADESFDSSSPFSAAPKKKIDAVSESKKNERLVDWMAEILLDHIKKIVSEEEVTLLKSFGDCMFYYTSSSRTKSRPVQVQARLILSFAPIFCDI